MLLGQARDLPVDGLEAGHALGDVGGRRRVRHRGPGCRLDPVALPLEAVAGQRDPARRIGIGIGLDIGLDIGIGIEIGVDIGIGVGSARPAHGATVVRGPVEFDADQPEPGQALGERLVGGPGVALGGQGRGDQRPALRGTAGRARHRAE